MLISVPIYPQAFILDVNASCNVVRLIMISRVFLHYFDSFQNRCCITNLNEEPNVCFMPPVVKSHFRYQSNTL